jgi:hypothetical protein
VTDSASSIPVELASFSARVHDRNVILAWRTETESENHGFEVQRRNLNDQSWSTINFVPGNGTTTYSHQYSYRDVQVRPGSYRYRLRQIDYSGASEVSHEIEVLVAAPNERLLLYKNYPNPFNPDTQLHWHLGAPGFVQLDVFNVFGEHQQHLDLGEYSSGEHFYRYAAPESMSGGVYYYRITTPLGSEGAMMVYLP